jgi:hypothetical protein
MKRIAQLVIVGIAFALFPISTSSAAIVGTKCSKAGATKKTATATYICKKSGTKLTWQKVVKKAAAPKPSATPSPSSTPTPTPTPEPTPITPTPTPSPTPKINYVTAAEAKVNAPCEVDFTTAFTLDGPVLCLKTWNLVAKENDSVESRAYRYVLEEYLARPEGKLSLIWRIDPTTPEWKEKMQTGMIAGARLWGTSPEGSAPRYVFISHDPDWLFDAFVKDGLIKSESRRANMFQGLCNAGLSGAETRDESFWFYKFSQAGCLTNAGFFQVPAHEYTHYAQEVLSKKNHYSENLPWLNEGLPSFIGSALGPMSNMRNDIRALWLIDLARTQKDLAYFSLSKQELYREPNWGDVYPLGAIANEALVAAVGFRSVKQIYIELANNGTTYDQAFLRATGLNISKWTELLQGYVDSVKRNSPWTLQYLLDEVAKKKAS